MSVGISVQKSATRSVVAEHGHWVNGEATVHYSLSELESLEQPHQTQSLEMSLFLDEGYEGATITLTRHLYTRLGGVWEDKTSHHISLLSHENLTIDEVRMLADTLNAFVTGIDNGTIKPE